jgi:hypothetical protein
MGFYRFDAVATTLPALVLVIVFIEELVGVHGLEPWTR